MNKRPWLLTAALVGVVGLGSVAGPVSAQSDEETSRVCPPLSTGKIDTIGDPPSVTVPNADAPLPEGAVITGYCVKAGSAQSGGGPIVMSIDEDDMVTTLTITYPGIDSVSHYSVLFSVPEEPPTEEPPTEEPPTEEPPTEEPPTEEPPTEEPPTEESVPRIDGPATAPDDQGTDVEAAGPLPPAQTSDPTPAAESAPALPATGSSSWALAGSALVALLAGLGLLRFSRRPRESTA